MSEEKQTESEEKQTESEEIVKVETLTPNSKNVNTIVKVKSKGEIRNVTGRDYSIRRVTDALVGDETGCIYLTLWEDNIDNVNEEDTLQITNGYINLFKGNMRLNIGKYGSFKHLEESPITEINTDNNLSDKRYERERRYRRYDDRRGYRQGGRGYRQDRRGYRQDRRY